MLDGIIIPVQVMLYGLIYLLAEIMWGLNQAILFVGYYILTLTSWLSQQMFQPLLTSIGNSTDSLLLPVFTMAMLVLAITYMLGVFGFVRVVEFKSAIMWLLVAVMWFQFGPQLYIGFEQFRRDISGGFYATVFADVTGGSGTIEGLGAIGDAGDLEIDPPQNNFGAQLSFDTSIDGLDIALAYLDADGCDVLRSAGCLFQPMPSGDTGRLPLRWYDTGGYYDIDQHSYFYQFGMTQEERQKSLDDAARGIWIGLSGIILSIFGMIEQVVQLLLTIAFGIAFASFFIAILFAFFKKTEAITWAVFNIILGLFIQSIITSLLLALVMAFVSVAGATGNGILLFGVGFLGVLLVTILLYGAVMAILESLNGLLGAFGEATGGNLGAAGTLTGVANSYATGGATLAGGGNLAQAAGAALGPRASQQAYYAARTFGQDSMIGRTAQSIAEGSTASYLGPVGGFALGYSGSQHGRENEGVSDMTLGTPIRASSERVDPLSGEPYQFAVQGNGQGRRIYEDGSELYTTPDDVPLDRQRAAFESYAIQSQNEDLSDSAIGRIDAADNDESADLLAAVRSSADSATDTDDTSQIYPDMNSMLSDGTDDDTGSDLSSMPPPDISSMPPVTQDINLPADSDSADTDSDEVSYAGDNEPTSTEAFLLSVENAYPGSTGRDDLVNLYLPDSETDSDASGNFSETVSIPIEDATPSESVLSAAANAPVINVEQVGPATEARLSGVGIQTAGQLASASPDTLMDADISESRANFLIGQGKSYINDAAPSQSGSDASDISASEIAAEIDASNNDDAARLANQVASAMRMSSVSSQGVPTAAQATEAARQAGLPDVPESGRFIQFASAMGLNEQQAQSVVQDVRSSGQMGPQVAIAVRSSLASLGANGGPQLDASGVMQSASLLEQAARNLVNASTSTGRADANSRNDGDAATTGSSRPVRSPSTSD